MKPTVAVIGGGIAGTAAAHAAALAGAEVTLVTAGMGASSWGSGALDLTPWDEHRPAQPLDDGVVAFARDLGVWELPTAGCMVASRFGLVRPARGVQLGVLDLGRVAGRQVGVAALAREGWDAALVAAALAGSPWAATTRTRFSVVELAGLAPGEAALGAHDFAALHDDPARLDALLAELSRAATNPGDGPPVEAWLLGPWLGVRPETVERAGARSALPLGEVLSPPDGPAGPRFEAARDALLGRRRVSVVAARVTGLARAPEGLTVALEGAPPLHAGAVVLATGGLAADGIRLGAPGPDHGSRFELGLRAEVVLELDGRPLDGPSTLHPVDLSALGLGALLRVGLPRTVPGLPLFPAGEALAAQARTALSAAETGVAAGRAAVRKRS